VGLLPLCTTLFLTMWPGTHPSVGSPLWLGFVELWAIVKVTHTTDQHWKLKASWHPFLLVVNLLCCDLDPTMQTTHNSCFQKLAQNVVFMCTQTHTPLALKTSQKTCKKHNSLCHFLSTTPHQALLAFLPYKNSSLFYCFHKIMSSFWEFIYRVVRN
jgi:hypothetical protein